MATSTLLGAVGLVVGVGAVVVDLVAPPGPGFSKYLFVAIAEGGLAADHFDGEIADMDASVMPAAQVLR